jgi:hypothetical protein
VASQVDIANLALSYLGAATITSLSDPTTSARVINAEYDLHRKAELRGPNRWRFAIARTTMAASATSPASGPYSYQYPLPADCLRVLDVGDSFPAIDLSDYRTSWTTADYQLEGRQILTNLPAPLSLRYTQDLTDTSQFDSLFVIALAAKLAWTCCERITQSEVKRKLAIDQYQSAISDARRTNALELVPEYPADSAWVIARMQ